MPISCLCNRHGFYLALGKLCLTPSEALLEIPDGLPSIASCSPGPRRPLFLPTALCFQRQLSHFCCPSLPFLSDRPSSSLHFMFPLPSWVSRPDDVVTSTQYCHYCLLVAVGTSVTERWQCQGDLVISLHRVNETVSLGDRTESSPWRVFFFSVCFVGFFFTVSMGSFLFSVLLCPRAGMQSLHAD